MKGGTLYAELRAALDRGHHLQHVEEIVGPRASGEGKRAKLYRYEVPVYWKRTHGKNDVTLWGNNYLAELGAHNDDD